jgi:acetolactate synthase regulatory subunit
MEMIATKIDHQFVITATNSEDNLHRIILVFKRKKAYVEAMQMQTFNDDMVVKITTQATSEDGINIQKQLEKIVDVISASFNL